MTEFNPQAARERREAATARLAYWESQWRASANAAEKAFWYEAIVRDLHDAVSGFAAALEALKAAQGKLDALRGCKTYDEMERILFKEGNDAR